MKRGAVSRHRSKISRELNALSNPFEAGQTQVADQENGWTAEEAAAMNDAPQSELDEVDTPEALDDEPEDTVADGVTTKVAPEKTAKEPKAPARALPPEGLITPVAFAKVLTEHLSEKQYRNKNGFVGRVTSEDGTAGAVDLKINPIPPQCIYSMINQGNKPNAKNPVPTYVSAHDGTVYKSGEQPEGTALARINLMKSDESLAWWDAKDERVAASKTAKAEADKK